MQVSGRTEIVVIGGQFEVTAYLNEKCAFMSRRMKNNGEGVLDLGSNLAKCRKNGIEQMSPFLCERLNKSQNL